MQLDLPFEDHVERARALKKTACLGGCKMVIMYSPWTGSYWLTARSFEGPEVEWRSLLELPSKQAALDIKRAGVCNDWLDCLAG